MHASGVALGNLAPRPLLSVVGFGYLRPGSFVELQLLPEAGVFAPQWPEDTGGSLSVGVEDGRIYQELLSPAVVSTVSEDYIGHSAAQ